MNISRLFTRTFTLIFRNAALWVVVASMLVIETFFGVYAGPSAVFMAALASLVGLVATAIIIGAVVWIVNEMAVGRNPSISDGFKAGVRKAFPLLLVQLVWQVPLHLEALITTGQPLAAIAPMTRPEGLSAGALMYLAGSFSLATVVFFLAVLFASTIAIGAERAVVLEDAPALSAVVRGWNLLRSQFTSYIKIGLAAGLVSLGVEVLDRMLNGVATYYYYQARSIIDIVAIHLSPFIWASGIYQFSDSPLYTAVVSIFNLIFVTLTLILFTGVWTLAYRHWQGKTY